MSSLLVPSTVVRGPSLTIDDWDGQGVASAQLVYTVPANTAIRVESVYMVAEYNGLSGWADVFALQLIDNSGLVLCNVRSGLQTNTPISAYAMTWARGTVDTAQAGEAYWNFEMGEFGDSWWSGALPSTVLSAGSTIQVAPFRGLPTDAPDSLLVDQIAIAYTQSGSASTASDLADVLPFLLPAAGSST